MTSVRGRLWIAESTHTTDKTFWYNNCLVISDDGNLVIYDQRTGAVRWARKGFVPGRIPKPKPYKELFIFKYLSGIFKIISYCTSVGGDPYRI